MVNSGSRRRTRKVAGEVLDRLAAQEGAESRSRKRATRKVSAQLLSTLRDHGNGVPSASAAPQRAPGYGIVKKRRARSAPAKPHPTTQEHARILPPSPPETGPTAAEVNLRPAVDLDPPPLRAEAGTDPEFEIDVAAFDEDPEPLSPHTPIETASIGHLNDAVARLRAEATQPVLPQDSFPEPMLAEPVFPETAGAQPLAAESFVEPAFPSVASVVTPVAKEALTPIPVAPPCPVLPDAEVVSIAPPGRSFWVRLRKFLANLSAFWRSTQ